VHIFFTGILPSLSRSTGVQQVTPGDVFEVTRHTALKKIELKLPAEGSVTTLTDADATIVRDIAPEVPVVVGGFGRYEPELKSVENEVESSEEELGETEFVSSRQLRKGRITDEEMRGMTVFKNYEAGTPSSRLYIKNLAKTVTEKDLHRIYGRYVDWTSDAEKALFYKSLLTSGRMKGQAFITLPTERRTREAREDTNGFMLHDRPMVVSFSNSVPPKVKDGK